MEQGRLVPRFRIGDRVLHNGKVCTVQDVKYDEVDRYQHFYELRGPNGEYIRSMNAHYAVPWEGELQPYQPLNTHLVGIEI